MAKKKTATAARPREVLAGPPGTGDKLKRLAELLTADKGVEVNMRSALGLAVDEALAKYERKADR